MNRYLVTITATATVEADNIAIAKRAAENKIRVVGDRAMFEQMPYYRDKWIKYHIEVGEPHFHVRPMEGEADAS